MSRVAMNTTTGSEPAPFNVAAYLTQQTILNQNVVVSKVLCAKAKISHTEAQQQLEAFRTTHDVQVNYLLQGREKINDNAQAEYERQICEYERTRATKDATIINTDSPESPVATYPPLSSNDWPYLPTPPTRKFVVCLVPLADLDQGVGSSSRQTTLDLHRQNLEPGTVSCSIYSIAHVSLTFETRQALINESLRSLVIARRPNRLVAPVQAQSVTLSPPIPSKQTTLNRFFTQAASTVHANQLSTIDFSTHKLDHSSEESQEGGIGTMSDSESDVDPDLNIFAHSVAKHDKPQPSTSLAASDKGPKSTPDNPSEGILLEGEVTAKMKTLHKLREENDEKKGELECLRAKVGVLRSLGKMDHSKTKSGLEFIAQTLRLFDTSSGQEKKQ